MAGDNDDDAGKTVDILEQEIINANDRLLDMIPVLDGSYGWHANDSSS